MPMPALGTRIRLTTRIPPDDFREVAIRARARGWTVSAYLAWVIAKELRGESRGHKRSGPRLRVTEVPSPHLAAVAEPAGCDG